MRQRSSLFICRRSNLPIIPTLPIIPIIPTLPIIPIIPIIPISPRVQQFNPRSLNFLA